MEVMLIIITLIIIFNFFHFQQWSDALISLNTLWDLQLYFPLTFSKTQFYWHFQHIGQLRDQKKRQVILHGSS